MKQFTGFPARMQFTPVPNPFLTTLLAQINDINELKATLHLFRIVYQKRGYPRFATLHELLADVSLMQSLEGTAAPEARLRLALGMAVGRGTILQVTLDSDGTPEDIYFLNTASDRQAAARVRSGQLRLGGLKVKSTGVIDAPAPPDTFTLYEQNIGLITPLIAEQLRDAESLYPQPWIAEAIKEAVNQNKRKIGYILAILERWLTEGKGDGTHKRDSKKEDPDKYRRQKYGHLVQH